MNFATQYRIPLIEALFSGIATRGAPAMSSLKTWSKRRAVYHQTLAELSSLSQRELDDIAIPRSHIRRIARETARKV